MPAWNYDGRDGRDGRYRRDGGGDNGGSVPATILTWVSDEYLVVVSVYGRMGARKATLSVAKRVGTLNEFQRWTEVKRSSLSPDEAIAAAKRMIASGFTDLLTDTDDL